ncbi:MAG TPA: arginine decarboxylase, pyruvoyl-dependent [Balneolales bacterium]|nr:arginine decarboxylase, pyruvoyl-dependent [Balneolales bacterium]
MNIQPDIDLSNSLMVRTPNIYCLVKGAAEGTMPLNAFDNALLNAGVGDTNLMRMSSIVPPNCKQVREVSLPGGSLIPIAYASYESKISGEVISAAIAVGIPEDPALPGVIMEYEDATTLDVVEDKVRQMVIDAFDYRKRKLKEVKSVGIEHIVKKCGAVFAGAVLWYE